MKTHDSDIRFSLHENIKNEYKNEPDTIIVDELDLCRGIARIDIAVVNGAMHGYEIKSESDTLERLPNQVNVYNQVMDTMTIVAGKNHLEKISELVPIWWGITLACLDSKNNLKFTTIRETKCNPKIDALSVAQLLWRNEALEILSEVGLDKGYRTKSRKELWERLAINLSVEELKYYVRKQLKNRKEWRADSLHK